MQVKKQFRLGKRRVLYPYFLIVGIILPVIAACTDSVVSPGIPNVPVSIQLNVTSLQYPELRQDGGYVYLQGGYKGILLVRQNAATYLAFERACSYDPTASCAKVEVDKSNLFLIDKCCGSQFNFNGQVTSGPAVYGLKQYNTALTGSILYITN
jgi:hypothetical protein